MDEEDLRTIWCGNLSEKVTEELLYELFLQAGPLESVTIPADKDGKKRAYGFITYVHQVSVPYAIKLFKRTELFRRELNLKTRNRAAGETEPEAPQATPPKSSNKTGSSQPSSQLRPPASPRQTSAHTSSTKSDTTGSGITNTQRALHVASKNKTGVVSRHKGQIIEEKNASQSLNNENCSLVSDTSTNEIPIKKLSEENSDNQKIEEGIDTTSFHQEVLSEDIGGAERNQQNASSTSSSSSSSSSSNSEHASGEDRRSSQSSISSDDSIFQSIKPTGMISAAEEDLNANTEDTSQVIALNDEDQTNRDMIPSAIYTRQAAENNHENGTVVEASVCKNSENVTPQQKFSEELTSSSNSATEHVNSSADVHLHETLPRAPDTADSLDAKVRRIDNSGVLLSQGDDRNPTSTSPSTDHDNLSAPAVNFSRPHAQLIPEKEESQRPENSAVEYKINVNPLLQHLQNSLSENDSVSSTVHGSTHVEGMRNSQTRSSVNFNVSALSQTTALGISPIEAERKRYQSSISDVFRANLPRLYPRKPASGTNVNLSLPVCPSVPNCTGIQPDRPRTYSSIIRSTNNHSGLQSGSRFGAIGAERQSVRVSNLARSNLTGGVMPPAADITGSPHTGKQSLLNYQTEPSKVNYIVSEMTPKSQPTSRNTHGDENCQNSPYAMKRFPNYVPLAQIGRPAPIGSERAKGLAATHHNTAEFLFPSEDHNIRINSAKEEIQKLQPSTPKISPKSVPPAPVNQQKKPLMSLILEDLQKIQSSVGTTLTCSSAGQKLISKAINEAENKAIPGININNSPATAQRSQQKTSVPDSKDNHRIQPSNYRTSSSLRCKIPISDSSFATAVPNTPTSKMKGQRMQSSIFSNGRISSFSDNSPEPVNTKPLPTPIGAERRRKGNAPIYQPSSIPSSQISSHFVAIPHFPGGDCLRNQLMFGYKEVKRRTVVDGDSWD